MKKQKPETKPWRNPDYTPQEYNKPKIDEVLNSNKKSGGFESEENYWELSKTPRWRFVPLYDFLETYRALENNNCEFGGRASGGRPVDLPSNATARGLTWMYENGVKLYVSSEFGVQEQVPYEKTPQFWIFR